MDNVIAEHHSLIMSTNETGQRLDQAIAKLLPHLSRTRIQQWIKDGLVLVNGATFQCKHRLFGNEQVEIFGAIPPNMVFEPQSIPLDICYQDADIIILNKSSGLVTHPAAGNPDGTLQNALLHWFPELIHIPRAGIVHRLDKDTSGLLVIARSLQAHVSLIEQLRNRSMHREYIAVVIGIPIAGGTLDFPIGRHPTQRTRMAVTSGGKPAITHFRVQERFTAHSLIKLNLATGRTHQIRVHLEHINYPILGDPVYCAKNHIPLGINLELKQYLVNFKRQALHAQSLSLIHPSTGKTFTWEIPLPTDMQQLITMLRKNHE
jgi:23S rRNA pseudouridine1911/1915/1917 synthase